MNRPEGISPKTYAEAPEDIRNAVEQLIRDYGSDPALLAGAIVSATSRVIQSAVEAERARLDALLRDPAAVRVNYLRGGIACQHLIDEAVGAENERCARLCEDYEPPAYTDVGNACVDLAAAIRKGA